jgi:hypothetical protein
MPVLSKLVPIITGNFALQAAFASVFVPTQNEKFYDLCGALGFLTGAGMSLYYPSLRDKLWYKTPGATIPPLASFAPRQLLLTGCLCLWSGRLGSFLAQVSVLGIRTYQCTHFLYSALGKLVETLVSTRSRNNPPSLLDSGSVRPFGCHLLGFLATL